MHRQKLSPIEEQDAAFEVIVSFASHVRLGVLTISDRHTPLCVLQRSFTYFGLPHSRTVPRAQSRMPACS